jgi:hypothetical protein
LTALLVARTMEQPAVGPGRGARTSGGTLPRLDTEEGWERKEGGYGAEHVRTCAW